MITLSDVQTAQTRLRSIVKQTPLVYAESLSANAGHPIFVKAENLQLGGAFKLRGAYNKISSLSSAEKQRGVVAHSSGNHAIAVAYASKLLGVKAVIVIPEDAVAAKVEATLSYGAEVVRCRPTLAEREEATRRLCEQYGYVLVHPFNDPLIMAGQGTTGLEIMDALPDVQAVVSPVGGGGLISGIAVAVKSRNPNVKVIGVEPQGANDAYRSLHEGRLVTLEHTDTIADGLRSQHLGTLTYEVIRRYVDDIVLVSDEEILDTVRLLVNKEKLVIEPSGAVAAAALRLHRAGTITGPAVAVLSGGNIDTVLLRSLL